MKITNVWWRHMERTNSARVSMSPYIISRTQSRLVSYRSTWVIVTMSRTTMKKDLRLL
jgi:hypothetical protein